MLTFEGVFGGPVGTCRYNPPTQDVTWPIVLETDWCGKFEDSPTVRRRVKAEAEAEIIYQYRPPPSRCVACLYFSEGKILGQHPAVSA